MNFFMDKFKNAPTKNKNPLKNTKIPLFFCPSIIPRSPPPQRFQKAPKNIKKSPYNTIWYPKMIIKALFSFLGLFVVI